MQNLDLHLNNNNHDEDFDRWISRMEPVNQIVGRRGKPASRHSRRVVQKMKQIRALKQKVDTLRSEIDSSASDLPELSAVTEGADDEDVCYSPFEAMWILESKSIESSVIACDRAVKSMKEKTQSISTAELARLQEENTILREKLSTKDETIKSLNQALESARLKSEEYQEQYKTAQSTFLAEKETMVSLIKGYRQFKANDTPELTLPEPEDTQEVEESLSIFDDPIVNVKEVVLEHDLEEQLSFCTTDDGANKSKHIDCAQFEKVINLYNEILFERDSRVKRLEFELYLVNAYSTFNESSNGIEELRAELKNLQGENKSLRHELKELKSLEKRFVEICPHSAYENEPTIVHDSQGKEIGSKDERSSQICESDFKTGHDEWKNISTDTSSDITMETYVEDISNQFDVVLEEIKQEIFGINQKLELIQPENPVSIEEKYANDCVRRMLLKKIAQRDIAACRRWGSCQNQGEFSSCIEKREGTDDNKHPENNKEESQKLAIKRGSIGCLFGNWCQKILLRDFVEHKHCRNLNGQ